MRWQGGRRISPRHFITRKTGPPRLIACPSLPLSGVRSACKVDGLTFGPPSNGLDFMDTTGASRYGGAEKHPLNLTQIMLA